MISTVVSNIVFNDVTGYYRDYVLSHISGWGETRTAEHAIVLIQWIWVTVFTWILMPNWRRDANR
ncbi:hypothetical protein [Alicyclobacillus sp. ALC3]|uniref:hypothetical protein n=1 Tax=Alicyclobacillus sp. ALC3 TaxID=2796143 RepID=UPI002378445F|nr:hypothetical protein [Alicyclobacillus sp. ALC3]WDL97265.1 hypothetical protein JC200_00425 [Alicyclobacillus sp. ALC3]